MDIVARAAMRSARSTSSNTAAFVAAAGGVPVAKHGNRSVSSKSGRGGCARGSSARCPVAVARAERKGGKGNGHLLPVRTGLSQVHEERRARPARAWASAPSSTCKPGTLVNYGARLMQLLGGYDESLVMPMAQVLFQFGVTRGMVVAAAVRTKANLIGRNKVHESRDGKLTPR